MIRQILLALTIAAMIATASAAETAAPTPSRVTGTVLGANGLPLPMSRAQVRRPMEVPLVSVAAGRDGRFALTTSVRGLVVLRLSGLGHKPLEVPLWLAGGETIDLRASLVMPRAVETIDTIKVIGAFNHFSYKSGKTMTKQPDGTYVIELPSTTPVVYQLTGILEHGEAYEGQTADRFVWNHELNDSGYHQDGYRAVVAPRHGKVRIVFDPARLARPAAAPTAPAGSAEGSNASLDIDGSPISARLIAYQRQVQQRREGYLTAARDFAKTGKPWSLFAYDWSPAIAAIQKSLTGPEPEQAAPVRDALRIELWNLCASPERDREHKTTVADAACNAPEMSARLEQIQPQSTLWGWMELQSYLLDSFAARAAEDAAVKTYIDRLLDRQRGRPMMPQLLLRLLESADQDGRLADVRTYFTRLRTEYPTSSAARRSNAFSPDRRVRPGNTLPAFTVPALDNPAIAITNTTSAGKVLLIDVWATWCPGCRLGMPTVHRLYDKYHAAGLEILSVSADETIDEVHEYRAHPDTPMPWLHAYIGPVRGGPFMQRLELDGYPTYIVVDREGTIVLKGHDHEALDAAIAKALASGSAASPVSTPSPR